MIAPAVDGAHRADAPWQALSVELARGGVRYALLGETSAETRFVVAPDDLPRFVAVARECGFRGISAEGSRSLTFELAGEPSATRLVVMTRLAYGRRVGWLGTGEREERILRRAGSGGGRSVAAPQDELVDALLHCILDLGAFPPDCRFQLTTLMARLRRDALAGGRAAERVQQELAPALTWDEVLAAIAGERWDDLLARRRALRSRLLLRAPASSARRWMAGRLRGFRRRNGRVPVAADQQLDLHVDDSESDDVASRADPVSRKQIRGSGLLLTGRGLSSALKFLSELLLARYLTTSEYGSWTYALAAVVFLRGFAALGLHRAVARFMPMHLERGEREQFMGLLAFVFGSLLVTGTAVVLAFYAFPDVVSRLVGAGPDQRLDILFIVVLLVPVDAIDDFLTAVCAAFHDSRAIFVRRYVLNPGFRLGLALVLVLFGADVRLLAYGYLISGLVGIGYYAWSVYCEARRRGLFVSSLDVDLRLRLPVRRTLRYTVPVMGADWCVILMSTAPPLLLGHFMGVTEVALFQIALPIVALNTIVAQSFGVLFEPTASRLHQRADHEGLDRLYWRSALWVAVLTFPAFALSVAAAEPLTAFLFGDRYAAAAPILAVLAVGTFTDAALGFNAATLRVAGKVRWLLAVNACAAAVTVTLNLLFARSMGALGAGIATGASFVAYALAKQVVLHAATGVRMFAPEYARTYMAMGLTMAALLMLRAASPVGPHVLVPLIIAATLVVLHQARATLSITDTFPELGRWPTLARLLG